MRVCKEEMNLSLMSAAVLGALAAMSGAPMAAYAADAAEEDIAAIRRPNNFVEVGAANVGRESAKFGEYNGLNKDGGVFIGNFSVRGGDAYEGGDGTMRWGATGTNLGTTSREFGATVGNQGKWNLGIGYDELRHNFTNSYQTPYQGSMGGNNFTLPAGFGTVADTNSLSAAQKAAFHTVDIGSTRRNTSFNAGLNLGPQWDVKLEFNHLDQSGAKLMAFGSDATGATGQRISILPNPTNYKTDTVNLGLNWAGEQAHFSTSYFGSYFHDDYDRVTWTTFAGANVTDTMTTPPSNDFHQLNVSGGYNVATKTKIVGGISYSRNTQNDPFVAATGITQTSNGVTSLHGLVVNTHADLKLTDNTIKDLSLLASMKYDKRDNRTDSNIYDFLAIDGGNRATYPNTPLSTRKTQLELSGDYRLDKNQNVRLALNHDSISRWCNNYAVSNLYPAGTNCVVATAAKEDKLTAGYRLKATNDLRLNASYSYGKKTSEFDPLARTAMIGQNGGILSGVNPKGQNGGDFLGFHPYLDENRIQQTLKAGANWQANDQLSFGLNARYTDDNYDTQYGWKNGNQWSLNLDASYTYSENGVITSYVTQQRRYRKRTDLRNLNNVTNANATTINIPAYSTDSGTLKDDDFTVGLGFKDGSLFKGKLELVGDLSYSIGKTDYGTTLNWAGATTATAGVTYTCASAFLLTCGDLPTVKNELTQFKLTGTYQVDKTSKVALGYLFQRLHSNDYYYNGLQYGFTPTGLMPTNQNSNSYSVNVVAVSYIYAFK